MERTGAAHGLSEARLGARTRTGFRDFGFRLFMFGDWALNQAWRVASLLQKGFRV